MINQWSVVGRKKMFDKIVSCASKLIGVSCQTWRHLKIFSRQVLKHRKGLSLKFLNPGPGGLPALHICVFPCSTTPASTQRRLLTTWLVKSGVLAAGKTLKCAGQGDPAGPELETTVSVIVTFIHSFSCYTVVCHSYLAVKRLQSHFPNSIVWHCSRHQLTSNWQWFYESVRSI